MNLVTADASQLAKLVFTAGPVDAFSRFMAAEAGLILYGHLTRGEAPATFTEHDSRRLHGAVMIRAGTVAAFAFLFGARGIRIGLDPMHGVEDWRNLRIGVTGQASVRAIGCVLFAIRVGRRALCVAGLFGEKNQGGYEHHRQYHTPTKHLPHKSVTHSFNP